MHDSDIQTAIEDATRTATVAAIRNRHPLPNFDEYVAWGTEVPV